MRKFFLLVNFCNSVEIAGFIPPLDVRAETMSFLKSACNWLCKISWQFMMSLNWCQKKLMSKNLMSQLSTLNDHWYTHYRLLTTRASDFISGKFSSLSLLSHVWVALETRLRQWLHIIQLNLLQTASSLHTFLRLPLLRFAVPADSSLHTWECPKYQVKYSLEGT